MKRVLFVCTGNVCRSPMAEGLFRQHTGERGDFEVGSAGVSAPDGQPASTHTVDILDELDIDLSSHRSRQLTPQIVDWATHIFAMTRGHRDAIEAVFPEASDKLYLACEFSPDDNLRGSDIPDPIGLGRPAYELTCATLSAVIPSIVSYIDQTTSNRNQTPDPMTTSAQTAPAQPAATPAPDSAGANPSNPKTQVTLGADHGGVELKNAVADHLRQRGITFEDIGTNGSESVDYPDFAIAACSHVLSGRSAIAILCCTSGIGMSIAANRFPGIQASVVTDPTEAETTRRHNASNVLCLSGAKTSAAEACAIVDAYLSAPFDGGRHARRVGKFDSGPVRAVDPQVADAIDEESRRQQENIELIASENFTSLAVRTAQGSLLTNKYAEGYSGRRWYGGCEHVDTVETLAIDRAKALFGADHANVQPHSGSQANAAVYFSVLDPGDRILTMDLAHGGHLTHGHQANFSGRFFEVTHYGVDATTEAIDYGHLADLAAQAKPKMITAGASAYPRTIDFAKMAEIAKSVGAYLFVDMAHIAGLVAAGVHPSPVPHADFVTTTTHKSLRGPRGGIVLCRGDFAKKIDSQVFPGIQGGPLMHVIAAKAVCLKEALDPSFLTYQQQVLTNAGTLASELARHGFRIVSGGTDNHLMLVDVRPKELNGKTAQEALDQAGITVNKNAIPFDTESPFKAGGVRIGTPAVTTRGMAEREMVQIASWIQRALANPSDSDTLNAVRSEVVELTRRFPLP